MQCNLDHDMDAGMQVVDQSLSIEVLGKGEGLRVLGTTLTLTSYTKHEVAERVAGAWRKFYALEQLLLNRRASLKKRLRLFDGTVGSGLL